VRPMSAGGPSRLAIETRSYEMDIYSHLNNAVYVQWLEHARLVWLRERGLTYTSIPETLGVHIVVVSLKLDYRAEVVVGDRMVVVTDVVRLGNSSFTFSHRIEFDDGRVAAEGEVTMACTKGGRSAPMPAEFREKLR